MHKPRRSGEKVDQVQKSCRKSRRNGLTRLISAHKSTMISPWWTGDVQHQFLLISLCSFFPSSLYHSVGVFQRILLTERCLGRKCIEYSKSTTNLTIRRELALFNVPNSNKRIRECGRWQHLTLNPVSLPICHLILILPSICGLCKAKSVSKNSRDWTKGSISKPLEWVNFCRQSRGPMCAPDHYSA